MRTVFLVVAAFVVGLGLRSLIGFEESSGHRARRTVDRAIRIDDAPVDGAFRPGMAAPDRAWKRAVERVPLPEPVTGPTRIRGYVREADGSPLPDVVVTATPQWQQPLAADDLAARAWRYVKRQNWRAASRRRAVSNVDGYFELTGLGNCLYDLRAELSGYSFRGLRWNVYPGAIANFTAKRVAVLEARVLFPDGSEAAFARLHLYREGTQLGGIWSRARRTREVEPGLWRVKARHPVRKSLASAFVSVDAKWGEPVDPVVLRLEERPGIEGSIVTASGVRPQSGHVYLLKRDSGAPPPSAIFEGAEMIGHGRAHLLEEGAGGEFGFYDLDPGDYWVAVALPGQAIGDCVAVDVGVGVSTVVLRLRE